MRLLLSAITLVLATLPALAMDDFVLEDEVALCMGCHGEDGVPIDPEYPVIWGQQYFYIFTQLRDYSAGRREHEIMTPIAAEYTRDQAKLLSEHFAALAWPDIQGEVQDGDRQIAERGITGGQCSACHGKWQGDSRIPRVAGQQVEYIRKSMLDFKNEVRMNAPDKISTMKQIDDETIDALARYLSTVVVQ